MKLPVIAIIVTTTRDLGCVLSRHPLIVALALAFSIAVEQWLRPHSVEHGAAALLGSSASTVLQLIVWLPLWLVATREVVFGEAVALRFTGAPSAATWRYGTYSALIMLAFEPILWLDRTLVTVAAAILVPATTIWFSLRATLTFTSLALGRLDMGITRSIAATSGQTLRLAAIMYLVPAVIAGAVVALVLAVPTEDPAANFDTEFAAAMFAVTIQLLMLAGAIAGANVYRWLDPHGLRTADTDTARSRSAPSRPPSGSSASRRGPGPRP